MQTGCNLRGEGNSGRDERESARKFVVQIRLPKSILALCVYFIFRPNSSPPSLPQSRNNSKRDRLYEKKKNVVKENWKSFVEKFSPLSERKIDRSCSFTRENFLRIFRGIQITNNNNNNKIFTSRLKKKQKKICLKFHILQ